MRAGTNAQIVSKLPIVEVVKAAVPRLGVGRDFIALEPGFARHVGDAVEHGVGQVLLGNGRGELRKISVGLDRQVVNRDVRRTQGQRLAHVFFKAGQVLAGERIHDV